MPTFIDMFAGAGGFNEGFLQAEESGKHFGRITDYLDMAKLCLSQINSVIFL